MADDTSAKGTLQKINDSIGDLLHLQVITAVGDPKVDGTSGNYNVTPDSINAGKMIVTRLGLLDGDITTAMSESFVTNEAYADLRSFHQETVTQGNEIVRNNIQALKELVLLIKDHFDEKP